MLYINDWSIKMLKKRFSNYAITANCPSGSWQTSRYIQIFINGYDKDLHYEYRIDRNWNGRVELHFEGDWESKYGVLIDCLINKTQNSDELIWSEWGSGYRCQHANKVDTIEDLYHTLSYMMDIFNKNLDSLTLKLPTFEKQTIPCDESLPVQSDTVDIFKRKYKD